MQERLRQIHELGFPYLVADLQGQIVGYCYAAPYRPRPAYRYTIENSIYVASTHPRQGIGHALMEQLIKQCEQGPWRQMIAVIAGRDNGGSIALHRSLGFKDAGVQHATGYKFGRWIDVVFMQRALGDGDRSAPAAMGRH